MPVVDTPLSQSTPAQSPHSDPTAKTINTEWFAVAVSFRSNLVNLSGKMKENVFLFIPNLIGKYLWFF